MDLKEVLTWIDVEAQKADDEAHEKPDQEARADAWRRATTLYGAAELLRTLKEANG